MAYQLSNLTNVPLSRAKSSVFCVGRTSDVGLRDRLTGIDTNLDDQRAALEELRTTVAQLRNELTGSNAEPVRSPSFNAADRQRR